jgi:hypothetical protein
METDTAKRTRSPDASYDGMHLCGGISGRGSAPPNQATLKQAEAVRLAKTAAKKENDKAVDDFDVKKVTFDRTNGEWSVSFDPKRTRREMGSGTF